MSISNHEGENDSELLWWAAKAIGVHIAQGSRIAIDGKLWNPLEDDGDAFRLAVRLNIDLCPHGSAAAHRIDMDEGGFAIRIIEAGSKDERENARRAIVRVAAEIGRSMP